MDKQSEALNRFLVEVFNEILKTEERSLAAAYRDLSLRELHLLEEVCLAADQGRDNRASAIAAAQRVTAGTLTTSVTLLEKKGYLERRRDERDKRSVRILPTEKARSAMVRHGEFHREMVESVIATLSAEELAVFMRALGSVAGFFRRQEQEEQENKQEKQEEKQEKGV
ncbi:MAG: MarR family winged helix-turn-helix transcriptional regulator [Pseudoflavonifractor sp.]